MTAKGESRQPSADSQSDDAATTLVRLRRPALARLFSSPLQTLLTLYAAVTVGLVVAAVAGSLDWSYWYLYIIDVIAFAVWLLGVSAWAEVDDNGVRWRYWMKTELPWRDVSRVALGQRARVFQTRPGPDFGQPAVLVRSKGDEDFIRPAAGCGRRRREFGTAVLQAAQAHHKRTEVIGRHWSQAATTDEPPFA